MNTYKIIIPTLISIFFVGCGGGSKFPVASQKLHNSAIQSKPPSGKSNIYLFSTDLGERWPQTILLDSQNWGQVSGYKYLFAQVIPGKHSISITGEPSMPVQSRPIVFQTEADKNYFFNILNVFKPILTLYIPDCKSEISNTLLPIINSDLKIDFELISKIIMLSFFD